MGQGIRHTGQVLRDQLAHPVFMGGIDDRPQQTNRDRFDFLGLQVFKNLDDPVFVQRAHLRSVGQNSAGHLIRKSARNVGLRIGNREVERLHPPAFAKHKNVPMSLSGQERGLGGVPGDNGVNGMGRPVDEQIRFGQ